MTDLDALHALALRAHSSTSMSPDRRGNGTGAAWALQLAKEIAEEVA